MLKSTLAKTILAVISCFLLVFCACNSVRAQTTSNTHNPTEQKLSCIPPPEGYIKANNTKEYQELMNSVLANNPAIAAKFAGHKFRVLRAILEGNLDEEADNQIIDNPQTKPLISLVVFDYTNNRTHFFIVESGSSKIVREHTLSGRPQPSAEEIEAASEIVKADPSLANFLQQDAKIIGGFIVDGPAKSPEEHRYMQMRIVTPDMRSTKKVVIVDLSTDTVVSK